jgi:Skp family chaperone for outer membrane proteins
MIGDIIENKVFESYTFSAIGIGINENKSYINAITKMKTNSPQFTSFIEKAKEKIIQYYAARCEQILIEAKQQAANHDYQQAIYQLMQVPNICDCAEKCQTLMIEYYDAYTETTAAELLNDAKSKWASAPNAEGAALAADIIAQIPAGTKVQSELDALIAEINQKLRENEKRDWAFKMKQYEDEQARQKREFQLRKQQQEADIAYREKQQAADNAYRRQEQANRDARRRMLIDACRQVGLAFAKNYQPPTYNVKNVYAW